MVTSQYFTRQPCLDCKGKGCVYCRGAGTILLPNWITYNRGADEYQCKQCKIDVLDYGVCPHPALSDCMCTFADEDIYKCPKCGATG